MKGYTPPPRMTISNEPAPITRNITITEGISVKDLAEKLGIRAKDVIARMPSFSARSFTEIPSVIVMLRVIGAGSLLMVIRGGGV